MALLGSFVLLTAFVLASVAFTVSVVGARRQRAALIEGGIATFHAVTALMLVASAIIVHAFVVGDFTIKYVQHYSDQVQPLFYKLASYWGGLDGSIMFWVTLLALFGSVAVWVNRERNRLLVPWVVAVIAVVEMFFLFLMVIHNNPFDTFVTETHATGQGLNPLLQNFYMAIHPPMLYLGFVGMTIPYAFGMAALITGQLDDSWLRAVRRWTMIAWLFLTFGLALGGLWAYETLGWGGYWGWDPVENAALLPWFTATAFLHSVMVQERRGMLKVWNVTLVIITFFLTIFGTFMTRSGVVQSVHAFGEDKALAWMFTAFMVSILTISFALVLWRLPMLRARHTLDSWISRESAFLVNNWILLFSAFFVLFATMFPTLSEAIRGQRLTVAAPFFTKWMTPIGLILLFLTGVGPLLAWRKSTLQNLRYQFLWPTAATIVSGVAAVLLGFHFWAAGLCYALCAFVTVTILQEFVRGAAVRREATGTDRFTALVGLFARNRRRYGGYVIHLGIVLAFFGFAGNARQLDQTAPLKAGQQTTVGQFTVKFNALRITDDGQKQMLTADVSVWSDGHAIGSLAPARWFYRNHEQEPVSEIAIRRSLANDLYVVLTPDSDVGAQTATLRVIVNPLIDWIWFGVGVIIVGTIIALLPERAIVFATGRVPEGAVTTALLLLMVVGAGGVTLRAQHVVTSESSVIVPPPTPVELDLQRSIVCMCGGCGRELVSECPCSVAAEERAEIHRLVQAGMTKDEVIAYFVKKYGSQEVLAQPIDTGVNRLAWLFPYAAGLIAVVTVGGVARRWSRKARAGAPPGAPPPGAPELEARLDDELRDLD